jgi:serine/threonine-protein phosphatase 2B regulatory subunit
MGQHPSKGGQSTTNKSTPTKKSSDKEMLKHVLLQQERQREAHKKQQEKAKQLNTQNQSELQRSVMSARHEETPLLALSKSTGFSLILLRRLEVLFNIISGAIIRDNMIDPDELSSALGLSQNSILFLALFKLFDSTQTHRVNFRTWVLTLYNLSPQATFPQKCRFSFSLLDLNGDGSIEAQELVNLVKNVILLSSTDPRHQEQDISDITDHDIKIIVDQALGQADINGDGEISYEEYESLMKHSKHFYHAFTIDLDHLCAAFTSPEVQQAVLLSQDEALARTRAFQAKKYQHVIRESFSTHVVPMMQRLSVSSEYQRVSIVGSNLQSESYPGELKRSNPLRVEGAPRVEELDMKEWNTFERKNRGAFPSNNVTSMSSTAGKPLPLLSPTLQPNTHIPHQHSHNHHHHHHHNHHHNNKTPSTPTNSRPSLPALNLQFSTAGIPQAPVSGTMADLVRMRSMSGLKAAAIVPSAAINYAEINENDEWHLIEDPFATPIAIETNSFDNSQTKSPTNSTPSTSHSPQIFHNNTKDDGTPVTGAAKSLPRISLSRDIPALERKYSNALSPLQGQPPQINRTASIEVVSPPHGRILREKSEQSLLRHGSLSGTANSPPTASQPQLTNHKLARNQSAGLGSSDSVSNGNVGYDLDYCPPTTRTSLPQKPSPHHQPSRSLDLNNLPTVPSQPQPQQQQQQQSYPPVSSELTRITITTQPPSTPPIRPDLLLADLQTISEDTVSPITLTPQIHTSSLFLTDDDKRNKEHFIVNTDGSKEAVKFIYDLIDLDIEEEEVDCSIAMEQAPAPALARLLAALREDNPWD